MQKFGYFGLVILFSYSFINEKKKIQKGDVIQSIKVKQIIPTLDLTGNISSVDTSTVQIYYFQSKILYKIESRYADESTKNYSTLKIGYSFFITTDSGKTGYYYPRNEINNAKYISDNSILRNEWFGIVELNKLFIANRCLLLQTDNNTSKDEVHEYYELKDIVDTSFTRTAHFYYKILKCDLYVRPTHALDERKKMRLIKCEIHTPKQYSKEMKQSINDYSLTYLIEDVQLNQTEQDAIAKYFK
jgi:hypothetical protein